MRLYAGFTGCLYGAFFDFDVNLEDPCATSTISFDGLQILMQDVAYVVDATAKITTINTGAVIVTPNVSVCPALEYTIENSDGSPIDGTIFAFD